MSWYCSSCLTRGLRWAILNAVGQPGGAGPATARAARGQVAELGQVEDRAGLPSASRSALRLASLSSALVSRPSVPIVTSSGLPVATVRGARELVRVEREAVGLQRAQRLRP